MTGVNVETNTLLTRFFSFAHYFSQNVNLKYQHLIYIYTSKLTPVMYHEVCK